MTAATELGEQLVSLFGGITLDARPLDEVGDLLIDGAAWLNDLDADELRIVLKALELGATIAVLSPEHPQAESIVTYLRDMDTAERHVLAIAVPSAPPPPTVLLIDPTNRPAGDLVDHRTAPAPCPSCGAVNTGALSTTPGHAEAPQPGDVSVCAYCAAIGIYAESGAIRRPTADELAELEADPGITKARAAVIAANEARTQE